MRYLILLSLVLGMLMSCSSTKTSMIVSDNYDRENDLTTLMVFTKGNLQIPGQWTRTKYNKVSGQYFFIDNDSTVISIAKNQQNKYPFYTKTASDSDFIETYYLWEKDYYENLGVKIRTKTTGDNYIIWTANSKNTNTVFLYGAKNSFAYNFAIFTNNWSEENQLEFLKSLFNNN